MTIFRLQIVCLEGNGEEALSSLQEKARAVPGQYLYAAGEAAAKGPLLENGFLYDFNSADTDELSSDERVADLIHDFITDRHA